MIIKEIREINFSESDLLKLCKEAGFPNTTLNYSESLMGDATKIILCLGQDYTEVEIEKELNNWSGIVWSLISNINEIEGVHDTECTTYTDTRTGMERVQVNILLSGILYTDNYRRIY